MSPSDGDMEEEGKHQFSRHVPSDGPIRWGHGNDLTRVIRIEVGNEFPSEKFSGFFFSGAIGKVRRQKYGLHICSQNRGAKCEWRDTGLRTL